MTTSSPRLRIAPRTAFILAHPDDDTLIAGTMRVMLEHGAEVHGIWVTGAEHETGLRVMRCNETRAAMASLGLPAERAHFLDLPFLRLVDTLGDSCSRLAALLAQIRPEQVVVVAYEGGHIDHDAVNFMAFEAIHRAGVAAEMFEFPLYNGSGPVYTYGFRVNAFPNAETPTLYMPLSDSALRHKYEAMRHYRSQWSFMATFRVVSPPGRMRASGEPYRWCPPGRDHTVAPHGGRLNIERWFNRYMQADFTTFQRAVDRARTRG